jgi:hypothetical protein
MKFSAQHSTVSRGLHADERMYRMEEARPCAGCGAMTEWADVTLEIDVCSEECRHRLATVVRPVQPLVGQLMLREKLITEAQLEAALRAQATRDTYTPLGHVLMEQKIVTVNQLNTVLDKYDKRPRLGAVLVAAKVLTTERIEQAMTRQRSQRARLGETLLELRLANESQIKRALGVQLNVEFVDPDEFTPDPKGNLACLIKRSYAEKYQVVPIARLGNTLTVAMDDPTDRELIRTLESATGLRIKVVTSTRAGLRRALTAVYN